MLLAAGAAARAASPLPDQARAALARAAGYLRSIATEGGYLWTYSEDLKERRGEEKATATQIWVQPPGTPAVGMAFLRAYAATGDSHTAGQRRPPRRRWPAASWSPAGGTT